MIDIMPRKPRRVQGGDERDRPRGRSQSQDQRRRGQGRQGSYGGRSHSEENNNGANREEEKRNDTNNDKLMVSDLGKQILIFV